MSENHSARFLSRTHASGIESQAAGVLSGPREFHKRLPGYAPTPLIDAPELAQTLGIAQVLIKDESQRLGLPAFKILGASWAVYQALQTRLGRTLEPWKTIDELNAKLVSLRPLTLITATDGNHGRAVAHVAALFGLEARIYVPAGTAAARINGIESEGARVVVVDGTYDDAVAHAADNTGPGYLIISDTSWPGYEEVPRWVAEGYSTIFSEIDDQMHSELHDNAGPDLIPIQFGVGALAVALVRHYRQTTHDKKTRLVSIEPIHAACMLASMEAGRVVTVPGPHDSIMAGLNCGRVSLVAWPIVSRGLDAFLGICDDRAREAMRALARIGIIAGETGAAGLAGLFELLHGEQSPRYRELLGIDEKTRALIIVTEGATDPESYRRIVIS